MSLINHTYKRFVSGDLRLKPINIHQDAEILVRLDDACLDAENTILKKLFGEVEFLNFQNSIGSTFNTLLIEGYKVEEIFQPYDSTKVFFGFNDMLSYFAYFYFHKALYNDKATSNNLPVWNKSRMVEVYNTAVNRYYQAIDFIGYKKNEDSTLLPYIETEDLEYLNTFGI